MDEPLLEVSENDSTMQKAPRQVTVRLDPEMAITLDIMSKRTKLSRAIIAKGILREGLVKWHKQEFKKVLSWEE